MCYQTINIIELLELHLNMVMALVAIVCSSAILPLCFSIQSPCLQAHFPICYAQLRTFTHQYFAEPPTFQHLVKCRRVRTYLYFHSNLTFQFRYIVDIFVSLFFLILFSIPALFGLHFT